MKATIWILFTCLLLVSCHGRQKDRITNNNDDEDSLNIKIGEDSIGKATAIFWVDKKNWDAKEPAQLRTIKAKVDIDNEGKINLLHYIKEQPGEVQRYLNYQLNIFRVTKAMIDSGHIKTGEQYVQIRYLKDKPKY